ncbi:MAG: hypothetical protein ACW981_14985 [Candidatus Hodarchaeales archaeon]|jgi:hypothetical protein
MSITSEIESLYSVLEKEKKIEQNDSDSILFLQEYMKLVRLAVNEIENS